MKRSRNCTLKLWRRLGLITLILALSAGGCSKPTEEAAASGGSAEEEKGKLVPATRDKVAPNTVLYMKDGKKVATVIAVEPMHKFDENRVKLGWQIKVSNENDTNWVDGDMYGSGTFVKVKS